MLVHRKSSAEVLLRVIKLAGSWFSMRRKESRRAMMVTTRKWLVLCPELEIIDLG